MKKIKIPIKKYDIENYNLFIKCKKLPKYQIIGNNIITDEISYNYVFKNRKIDYISSKKSKYQFDYQNYIVNKALKKRNYAAFLDCGLGKTTIQLEW